MFLWLKYIHTVSATVTARLRLVAKLMLNIFSCIIYSLSLESVSLIDWILTRAMLFPKELMKGAFNADFKPKLGTQTNLDQVSRAAKVTRHQSRLVVHPYDLFSEAPLKSLTNIYCSLCHCFLINCYFWLC